MLGKVWGFLKYHHPAIAAGQRHWDYDLFRIMPRVLDAPDRAGANTAVHEWIAAIGKVDECTQCASLSDAGLYVKPDVDWISNEFLLGAELSADLKRIYRNRVSGQQFYVSIMRGVANPVFTHELGYTRQGAPDAGYRLLALFRYWNIVEYWSPNREIIGESWDSVLREFIPKMALAKSNSDYQETMLRLITRLNDGHAFFSAFRARPPAGDCMLPVGLRFVESSAVVVAYLDPTLGPATGLLRGDVIEEIGGTLVTTLMERWKLLYPASNEAARARDMMSGLVRGECGSVALHLRRAGETISLTADRSASGGQWDMSSLSKHDLPGAAFRKLRDDVAYIKISDAQADEVDAYFEQAKATKGLIIDVRNYPSTFPLSQIGGHLVDRRTPIVDFTVGDLANPGSFHSMPPREAPPLAPLRPHYDGKVVILVDEITQSSAEYHAMAFRAAPGAIVMGSTTAGADGNVSEILLPGGLTTRISGVGVYYPDRRPTQRVGIVPDVEVKPTIAGIRAGRDEVLEAALRRILGDAVTAAEIQTLASH
jgi:C-terminal processing protease CtpA/Prc